MIIEQIDGKFIVRDSYTGLNYGEYDTYEEAADKIREFNDDNKIN